MPPAAPPLCGEGGRPTDFGILIRERIASLAIGWPEVGFHRIELEPREVRVALIVS